MKNKHDNEDVLFSIALRSAQHLSNRLGCPVLIVPAKGNSYDLRPEQRSSRRTGKFVFTPGFLVKPSSDRADA